MYLVEKKFLTRGKILCSVKTIKSSLSEKFY